MSDPTSDPTSSNPASPGAADEAAAAPEPAASPQATASPEAEVARGELVEPDEGGPEAAAEERREAVEEPAKVMRIGSMIKQLLEEVRGTELDAPARDRLRDIYRTSIQELGTALSPDLRDELERVTIPFGEGDASTAELRIAQAQLVGWLEGLFHGIQATLFAQQMAARNQLEDMRRQLGPGAQGAPGPGGPGMVGPDGRPVDADARSGTYL